MFADTPTFKELGEDYSYFMQRSVVGTPGMSDEAAAYYRDLFAKLYETEEWQELHEVEEPARRLHAPVMNCRPTGRSKRPCTRSC